MMASRANFISRLAFFILGASWSAELAPAQVIEFENNGLRFQTLTRGGVTVMYAHLPGTTKDYSVLQVAVSNGSKTSWVFKPEDFLFERPAGEPLRAEPPRTVVNRLLERGSRGDVIKLLTTYEAGIYGLSRIQSTSGYEQRRQQMLAEMTSVKVKAAAAASAIAFVAMKLKPGESTDGALFYSTGGRPLGLGRLTVNAAGEKFVFRMEEQGKTVE